MLAGTLEKRARWRREWRSRFCVLREDRIDYFLQPPAILDDELASDEVRGSISLHGAIPTQEPGRAHCLRVGGVLLSCANHAEQQRWLSAILEAASKSIPDQQPSLARQFSDELEEPPLLLIPSTGPMREVSWHERQRVECPAAESTVNILLLDSSGSSFSAGGSFCSTGGGGPASVAAGDSGGARACCQMPLFMARCGKVDFPVKPLIPGSGLEQHRLFVHVHVNEFVDTRLSLLRSPICIMLCVVLALLASGSAELSMVATAMTLVLFVMGPDRAPRKRQVEFSVERLDTRAATAPAMLTDLQNPKWVGRWRLDKSCSEKYEPILADMGVNYVLRKAADSIKSGLVISLSESHVTILVKTLVTVEDNIPRDGSWTTKPVPPGSRMKGELRVRLTKASESELEMYTVFPEGDLRDTLLVHEDGNSFTRTVVRGELSVTRVFRRE